MPILKLIKENLNINFMKIKRITLFFSLFLFFFSLFSIFSKGLNLGIDFTGGSLIEVRFQEKINLNNLREKFDKLNLGEIQLQTIGNENDIVIRAQNKSNTEKEKMATINIIKKSLENESVEYRWTEFVGPKVGQELV